MKYKVTFYSPDRHIKYNGGRLPDTHGVGGGVNARIRLAQSLASIGHSVELICNCDRDEIHRGVHYLPLDKVSEIKTDILILTTSGDKLDISPVLSLNVSSKIKILLIHGVSMPNGVLEVAPDIYYPLSNFVLSLLRNKWLNVDGKPAFVSHRGVIKEYFKQDVFSSLLKKRDFFRLVYSGHPSKGRDTALMILSRLREMDSRYNLFVFGDERLWGERVKRTKRVPGMKKFGTVHQRKLIKELMTCSFGIFIQSREEPFGQTMIEAMTAGCIPIASPVGAYRELIYHGKNGYFVEGEPDDPVTWGRAAELIHRLCRDPVQLEDIRKNAMQSTLDWREVVIAWEQHWDILFGQATPDQYETPFVCPNCANKMILLADGLHCLSCGTYGGKL